MPSNEYLESRLQRLETLCVKLETRCEVMALQVALLPHLDHLPDDTVEFVSKALAAALKGDARKARIQLAAVAELVAEQYAQETKALAERYARVQSWFPLGTGRRAAPATGPDGEPLGPTPADRSPEDDYGGPDPETPDEADDNGADEAPLPPRRGLDLSAARDYPFPGRR